MRKYNKFKILNSIKGLEFAFFFVKTQCALMCFGDEILSSLELFQKKKKQTNNTTKRRKMIKMKMEYWANCHLRRSERFLESCCLFPN